MGIAFLYAGQGSQKQGMGRDLYESYPIFRKVLDDADPKGNLKEMMFYGSLEELSQTHHTQPAMAAFAAGVTAVLYENGIRPDMAAGLSLGEYSALHAAGVMDATELVNLTTYRGRAMEEAATGREGVMCAVMGLAPEKAEEACRQASSEGLVEVANYNTAVQTVIAGEKAAVEMAAQFAKGLGAKRCVPLNVSSAFHTSMMAPAAEKLHAYFQNMEWKEMRFPVIFNTTARPLEEGVPISDMLERQVQSSVRMAQTIEYMKNEGIDTVIEIGPGKALSGFVKRTARGLQTYAIEDVDSLQAVLDAFGE